MAYRSTIYEIMGCSWALMMSSCPSAFLMRREGDRAVASQEARKPTRRRASKVAGRQFKRALRQYKKAFQAAQTRRTAEVVRDQPTGQKEEKTLDQLLREVLAEEQGRAVSREQAKPTPPPRRRKRRAPPPPKQDASGIESEPETVPLSNKMKPTEEDQRSTGTVYFDTEVEVHHLPSQQDDDETIQQS